MIGWGGIKMKNKQIKESETIINFLIIELKASKKQKCILTSGFLDAIEMIQHDRNNDALIAYVHNR